MSLPTLLTIPNYAPAQGALLPPFEGEYLGYYESAHRQLVFIFRRESWSARVYLSNLGWGTPLFMYAGRLPGGVPFSREEAAWLELCWRAAMRRYSRSALENVIQEKLFGET